MEVPFAVTTAEIVTAGDSGLPELSVLLGQLEGLEVGFTLHRVAPTTYIRDIDDGHAAIAFIGVSVAGKRPLYRCRIGRGTFCYGHSAAEAIASSLRFHTKGDPLRKGPA